VGREKARPVEGRFWWASPTRGKIVRNRSPILSPPGHRGGKEKGKGKKTRWGLTKGKEELRGRSWKRIQGGKEGSSFFREERAEKWEEAVEERRGGKRR